MIDWSSDVFVVGAGIWGCTMARRLAESGRRVLVLENRAVVGGNCRCEVDAETGIEIHAYGSHIFHPNIEVRYGQSFRLESIGDDKVRALPKRVYYSGPIDALFDSPLAISAIRARDGERVRLSGDERDELYGSRGALHAHPRVQALPSRAEGCDVSGEDSHLSRVSEGMGYW